MLASPGVATDALSLAWPGWTKNLTVEVRFAVATHIWSGSRASVSLSVLVAVSRYGPSVRLDRPTVTLPLPALVSFSVKCSVAPAGPVALNSVALLSTACPSGGLGPPGH